MTGMKQIQNSIEKNLQGMIERGNSMKGFLNRVTYTQYQKFQMERWKTENASEGGRWKALQPAYKLYKLKRYGGGPKFKWVGGQGKNRPWQRAGNWKNYPGSGTKTLIATGRLVSSVIGPVVGASAFPMAPSQKDHRKIVTNKSLEVYTTVEYAGDVAEDREFMVFSRRHMREMIEAATRYMGNGDDSRRRK